MDKKKCGYGLALFFSSEEDVLKMAEKVMKNDKKWRVVEIRYLKKAILDKAIELIDEEEEKQRKVEIILSEKSRLRIKERLSGKNQGTFAEGGVSE